MSVVTIEAAIEAAGSGYLYLASPYSKWAGGIHDACRVATKLTGELILRGVPVYSPIAHTHHIAVLCEIDPFDHSIWMKADKPMVDSAAGLIIADLPGWRSSYGVAQEIDRFRDAGKPIYLLDVDKLEFSEAFT